MKISVFSLAFVMVGSSLSAQTANPQLSLLTQDAPSADAEIIDLGRHLFFDSRLSGDASTACSDCHNPDFGWTDGAELSRGYPGTKHWRNSQTIVNVGFIGSGFHRDSGVESLGDQIVDAMSASFVANIDTIMAEERLRQIPIYVDQFDEIWGEAPTMERIVEAIAAFEESLLSNDSPYDQYMAGQTDAMSQSALRGMEIFNGKANCSSCHTGALTSDGEFHNTSVPPNPAMSEEPLRQVTFRYLMRRLDVDPEVSASLDRDPGRYLSTKNSDDLGRFRTPGLRYLKYTAPYMHNGIFYTLEEVVEFYNSGGTEDVFGSKSSQIVPLNLSRNEQQDLVAFLTSLSGSEVTVDLPDLPEYEVQSFPASSDPFNLASLPSDPVRTTPTPASAEPAASGALELRPRGGTQSDDASTQGLALVPRNADTTAPESTPEPQEEASLQPERVKNIGGKRYVLVEPGDTLASLADLIYGNSDQFTQLFEANQTSLSNPDDLRAGMLLLIP